MQCTGTTTRSSAYRQRGWSLWTIHFYFAGLWRPFNLPVYYQQLVVRFHKDCKWHILSWSKFNRSRAVPENDIWHGFWWSGCWSPRSHWDLDRLAWFYHDHFIEHLYIYPLLNQISLCVSTNWTSVFKISVENRHSKRLVCIFPTSSMSEFLIHSFVRYQGTWGRIPRSIWIDKLQSRVVDAAADHSPWWYLPVANAALQELLCSKETSINFVCFKKATSALFFSFLFFLSFFLVWFISSRERVCGVPDMPIRFCNEIARGCQRTQRTDVRSFLVTLERSGAQRGLEVRLLPATTSYSPVMASTGLPCTSVARCYADVNSKMPPSYWDYDNLQVQWG